MAEESFPRGGLQTIKKEKKTSFKVKKEQNDDLFVDLPTKKKRKLSIDNAATKHVKNVKQIKLSDEATDLKNVKQEVLFTNKRKEERKERKRKKEMLRIYNQSSKETKFNDFIMKPQELVTRHVRESMLILGYIKEISDTHMMIALPNGRRGQLPITNISDGYLESLKKYAEMSNEDAETLHSLSELFKVGMLLPCKVVPNKTKIKSTVPHLSINPRLVNEHLTKENLTTVPFFYGSICGVEDTGYIVEIGVEDSLCFLNNKHTKQYIQNCNNGERLKIGQCIRCKVLQKSKKKSVANEKYLPVTIDQDEINKVDLSPNMGKSELVPGMRVKAYITQITREGLTVSCVKQTGFVHYSQLPKQLTTYTVGEQVECCVLYTNPGGQTTTLTALPHIVNYIGEPVHLFGFGTLCVGRYISDAKVTKVKKPKGVFFKLEGKAKGFANMENIDENEEYNKGSLHRCIVTSVDYIENKVQVSLKMETIKELIKPADLVGEILTGTVVSIDKDGTRLTIWDKLNGIITKGRMHKDEVHVEGQEIKCRVLAVNNVGILRLTNLPSVLESTSPVFTQSDQLVIGQDVEGFANTRKKELEVNFYGNLEGTILGGIKKLGKFENWERIWCTVKNVKHNQLFVKVMKTEENNASEKDGDGADKWKIKASEDSEDKPAMKKDKGDVKIVTETFKIPERCVGTVIGIGGETVKNLAKKSGANINLENAEADGTRLCELSGSKKAVEKAKKYLMGIVNKILMNTVSEKLTIPENKTGLIIGKQGRTIHQIENTTNTRMSVENKMVVISGSKDGVERAKKTVLDIIQSEGPMRPPEIAELETALSPTKKRKLASKDDEDNDVDDDDSDDDGGDGDNDDDDGLESKDSDDEISSRKRKISENVDEESTIKKGKKGTDSSTVKIEVWVPDEYVGRVIGKGGSMLKDIVEKSGARVFINKAKSEGADRTCQIIGKEDAVKAAHRIIESLMKEEKVADSNNIHEEFSIPSKLIGKVIGKKGTTINGIREKSGANVFFKESEAEGADRICVISGTDDAVKTAQEMLNKLLTETEVGQIKSAITAEMVIPKEMVGKLIGKKGQTVKKISMKSGTKINIKAADTEEADRICEILGTDKAVEKAKESIMNLLERSSGKSKEAEEREVKDLEEEESIEGEPLENEDDEGPNNNIVVTVLVPSVCVERLTQDKRYTGLQTDPRVKLSLEHEDEEMEGICTIAGEEEAVIEIKKKLERIMKKLGKKISKKTADKPTLQLTDSISWDTEFKMPNNKDAGSNSEDETEEKPAKKTKQQIRKEKKEEEKRLHEYEMKKLEGEIVPETADDFDRLVVTSPDSSVVWLRYMAFHLETSEIDKAREVAERALKTISFREDKEKQNVWVAYLNLENMYGSKESLDKVLSRAVQYCEPLDIYLPLANMYIESHKMEDAERIYSTVVKKYSGDKMVWAKFGEFYFQQNRAESGRNLLQRSLKALENRFHVETITKFAQLEFKYGEPERGKTMFENVLSTYPKRTDIWSVYVDLLIKLKDHDATRVVFRKMISQKLQAKKIKFFFKKYLEFEEKYGTEAQAEEVKQKALQFVELGGIQE